MSCWSRYTQGFIFSPYQNWYLHITAREKIMYYIPTLFFMDTFFSKSNININLGSNILDFGLFYQQKTLIQFLFARHSISRQNLFAFQYFYLVNQTYFVLHLELSVPISLKFRFSKTVTKVNIIFKFFEAFQNVGTQQELKRKKRHITAFTLTISSPK